MGCIGHPDDGLITIDSPGIPMGGKYGDPIGFAKRAKKHGLLLAWSVLWDCFVCYTQTPDGMVRVQWLFNRNGGLDIQPIRDEHLDVFLFMREQQGTSKTLLKAYYDGQKERKDRLKAERKARLRAMRGEAMRYADLRMGLRSPMASIIVPGVN